MKITTISSVRLFIVMALALPLLNACTKKTANSLNDQVLGERLAPASVEESLRGATVNGRNVVVLKKSSLGKAFLMLTSLKTPSRTAEWKDSAPVLVSFERSGNQIALYELVQKVYTGIEPEQLISSFQIQSENETELSIQFDLGLNSVSRRSHFEGIFQSKEQVEAEMDGAVESIRIKDRFLKSVRHENNTLVIEQNYLVEEQSLVTTKTRGEDGNPKEKQYLKTVDVSYLANIQIRPYRFNEKFEARVLPKERVFGFFTVARQKENLNETESLAQHWDLDSNEKVPVYLSSDIPAHILPAAEEGVLYWNRAVGKELFHVVKNVDTRSIPLADRAITIRWIQYDDAGMAYASMQADPLTGEILRGQVYMTSAFLRLIEGPKQKQSPQPLLKNKAQLANLRSGQVCNLTEQEIPLKYPEATDPAVRNELARDIIRFTIAHEMGHLMGLRHHFSSSFVSGYTQSEVVKLAQEAYQNKNATGHAVTTSVMEYPDDHARALIGRHIQSSALSYDQDTQVWARTGQISNFLQEKPYCSDEEVILGSIGKAMVLGCDRMDRGSDPLVVDLSDLDSKMMRTLKAYLNLFVERAFKKAKNAQDAEENFKSALTFLTYTSPSLFYVDTNFKKAFLLDSTSSMKMLTISSTQEQFWGNPSFEYATFQPSFSSYEVSDVIRNLLKKMNLGAMMRDILLVDQDLNPVAFEDRVVEKFLRSPLFKRSGQTDVGVSYELTESQVQAIGNNLILGLKKNRNSIVGSTLSLVLQDASKNEKYANLFANEAQAKEFFGVLRVYLTKNIETSESIKSAILGTLDSKNWQQMGARFDLNQILQEQRETLKTELQKMKEELSQKDPASLTPEDFQKLNAVKSLLEKLG